MVRKSTKDILAESFLELAKTNRIDKIRISDITGNCGMSQPTFYNHFKDKYDLIVWIYVNDVRTIMAQIGNGSHSWREILVACAEYYAENKDFVLNALKHTSGHDAFLFRVQKINIDYLVAVVREKLMTEEISDEIMGIIKVYVYGTVSFMLEWLLGNLRLSPEQVADIWEKSLPQALKQYFDAE